jgi:hypothetical protein
MDEEEKIMEYPQFIVDIFTADIPKEGKDNFRKKFFYKYMTDKKFRDDTRDQYILFFNGDYHGIYKFQRDTFNIGGIFDDKFIIKIGDNSKNYKFYKYNEQKNYVASTPIYSDNIQSPMTFRLTFDINFIIITIIIFYIIKWLLKFI